MRHSVTLPRIGIDDAPAGARSKCSAFRMTEWFQKSDHSGNRERPPAATIRSAPSAINRPDEGGRAAAPADYAASRSRAAPFIIAAPCSAIIMVGALVLVEVTAGITDASITRSPSMPCTRN